MNHDPHLKNRAMAMSLFNSRELIEMVGFVDAMVMQMIGGFAHMLAAHVGLPRTERFLSGMQTLAQRVEAIPDEELPLFDVPAAWSAMARETLGDALGDEDAGDIGVLAAGFAWRGPFAETGWVEKVMETLGKHVDVDVS